MSICGKGMLTRSLPFLPIISPRLMYLHRLLFTLPRTSLRKRWWSRSIFCPTAIPPELLVGGSGASHRSAPPSEAPDVPRPHSSRRHSGRRNHRAQRHREERNSEGRSPGQTGLNLLPSFTFPLCSPSSLCLCASVVNSLLLRVPPGEDAGHEGQHVGGTGFIIAVVADQALLTMSIFSCVALSTTLDTRLVSLIVSFWSSNSFSSRAFCSRSLVL